MRLPLPRSPLWRDPDFMLLWVSLILGDAGAQITVLALASVAILNLHAGAYEVGLLVTAAWLPWAFLALPAGVLTDRVQKRRLLISSTIGRGLVVATVPIAFLLGFLTLRQVYVVALLEGSLNVLYSIVSTSYVPALIGKEQLLDANSKIFTSRSAASLGAPGFGGYLIGAIGAALTIWASTIAFLLGGFMTILIRRPEIVNERRPEHASGFIAEIREGLQIVFGNPTLRLLVGNLAMANIGGFAAVAIELVYFYDALHLSPAIVGLILAMEGVGSIVGAVAAQPIARRFGLGPTLIVTNVGFGLSIMAMPLAGFGVAVPVLGLAMFSLGLCAVVFDVNQVSMRQAITPDRLQGRMTATIRMVVLGVAPVGAFLGGVLGAGIGLVPTILLGGLVVVVAFIWLLPADIRHYVQPRAA